MSNAEIEDVLSSIRRLVSEDVRSQRVQRLTLGQVDPVPARTAAADALVLTPAQRVAEPPPVPDLPWTTSRAGTRAGLDSWLGQAMRQPEPAEEAPEAPMAEAAAPEEAEDPIAALERTISELEAAVADIEGEFEPDLGETVESGEAGTDLQEMFLGDAGAEDDLAGSGEWTDESAAAFVEVEEEPAQAGEDDLAGQDAEPVAAWAEEPAAAGDAPDLSEDRVEASLIAFPGADLPAEETTVDAGYVEDSVDWAAGLEAPLTEGSIAGLPELQAAADLEVAVPAPANDMWLADAAEEGAEAAAGMADSTAEADQAWAGEAVADDAADEGAAALVAPLPRLHLGPAEADAAGDEAEDRAEERAPVRIIRSGQEDDLSAAEAAEDDAEAGDEDLDLPEVALSADGEEAVIDADALRDLVVEIIRQELQGALGERITRNVRKLVRREINRALDTRELE